MRLMPLPTLVPILLSCSKGHFDTSFPLSLAGFWTYEATLCSRLMICPEGWIPNYAANLRLFHTRIPHVHRETTKTENTQESPIGQSVEYDAPAVIERESKVKVDLFRTDHENLMKTRYDPDSGNLEPSLTPFANMYLLFSQIFLFCGAFSEFLTEAG